MKMERLSNMLSMDLAERDFPVADKDDTLTHAFKLMEKHSTDRVLVTDDKVLVGIMTKRDVLGKLMVERTRLTSASKLHISSFMSQPVIVAPLSSTLKESVSLMASKRIGSVPLTENEEPKALLHKIDLAKAFTENGDLAVKDLMQPLPKAARLGERILTLREEFLRGNLVLVPVLDTSGRLLGMVTASELADALLFYHERVGESSRKKVRREIFVEDIMYRPPLTVDPEDPISVPSKLMLDSRKPGVIVMRKEEAVGILTTESLVNYLYSVFSK